MTFLYWTPRINDGGNAVIVTKPMYVRAALDEVTTGLAFSTLIPPFAIATSAGQELQVQFTLSASADAPGAAKQAQIALLIDGMPVSHGTAQSSMAAGAQSNPAACSLQFQTVGLAPGAHTMAVEWAMIALPGEMQCRAFTMPSTEHADLVVWTLR